MKPLLFDQWRAYIVANAAPPEPQDLRPPPRAVTISRQTGAGAVTIGRLAAEILQERQHNERYPWAVFDRELIAEVIRDHGLPTEFEKYMPEDAAHRVQDLVEDLLDLHPPAASLVRYTARTVLRLSLMGNVILIGRGANFITSMLDHVLHVRLVAPFETRVRHVEHFYKLGHRQAEAFVRTKDRARARYVRRYFKTRIDNTLPYHLTINTELAGFAGAARMIADAAWNLEAAR